jgi:hypothetical protein
MSRMTLDFPDYANPVIPGQFSLAGSGVRLVAVSGAAVALRAATTIKQVMVKARRTNLATLYVGAAGVTADETAATGGFQLDPGDIVSFPESDLAHIFVNGTAGDGVSYAWLA